MKTTTVIIWMFFFAIGQKQQEPFQKLATLAGGTWVMAKKKGFICERWQKINDAEIRNTGYRIAGADTTILEEVKVVEKGSQIFYIPAVRKENGGNPVSFKLTSVHEDQFTFSNPEHDYPQQVVYHLVSTDSLHAWTDGMDHGKRRKIDFYYHRTK